jgi:hypothetical protein
MIPKFIQDLDNPHDMIALWLFFMFVAGAVIGCAFAFGFLMDMLT